LWNSLVSARDGWWLNEPIRWVQTNLRETDANLDAAHLVRQLADMRANVLLLGMGGITAYYPSRVEFHSVSPYLPPGRDMFGDVLQAAHAKKIRVVGRFDFSKTSEAASNAHPEWFFRKANGDPVIYNGLYSTCINGAYYREQAVKILSEALDKYPVDGLFFNAFGNQSRDYSGNDVGLCHCAVCRRKYAEMFHKEIPKKPDDDYRKFMFVSSREVASIFGDLIHKKRPQAGYFNYVQESTDGIMSESNTAVARPLPLWPYSASDNVNRALNSEPGKMPVNLCMQFVDYWWRFATVPRDEIALRLWENVANGGALAFEVNGTLDQQDRQAVETAKPIFRWLAENEQYYSRERSAARVLLLTGPSSTGQTYSQRSYRGLFRLLSEEHMPFAVSNNMRWLDRQQSGGSSTQSRNRQAPAQPLPGDSSGDHPEFDLVIATDWAPPELRGYAEHGGHVLIVSPQEPQFPLAEIIRKWPDRKGYLRVRDHSLFPSLHETDLLMLDGPLTELAGDAASPLTLIPPSMIGPPEKVHVDWKDTQQPGLIVRPVGKGTIAWIPWDLGALYYRESLPAHAGLFRDVVDRLNPARQLRTNAHPLVEITWMQQGDRKLLHLVNLSGHSQTGYFPPLPMTDIHVAIAGRFKQAVSIRAPGHLPLHFEGGYTSFTLPRLTDYELIVLN
jgi:putative glycosyl hydrolase-like family 6 (GHL6) protein